jgi:lipoate-protein ligase A
VWRLDVDSPALVLGSTQADDVVDPRAATELGFAVARRRSGGGAVVLVPGESLWVDVIVPAGDALWDDDVGRSFLWLGHCWADALRTVGLDRVDVHQGVSCQTTVGRLVCFGGLGSGEVTIDGDKAVGLSQRRTRDAARFQCVVHAHWQTELYRRLLAPALADADRLASLESLSVATVPADRLDDLFERLVRLLDAAG